MPSRWTENHMSVEIIYDGECPFCTNFVQLVRLRETFGPITLIDARKAADPRIINARQRYNLDNGFLVTHAGREYYGPKALEFLSLATSDTSWQRHVLRLPIFRGPLAAWSYPAMVAGRNLTLRLRGRKPMGY
jgi:predicted DCC family thiol-disulfide oxidoreductase YuxK